MLNYQVNAIEKMTEISFYNILLLTIFTKHRGWLFLILLMLSTGCRTNQNPSEGISGKILWFEGDLMPGINKKPVKGIPVKREIYIYEPTLPSQADSVNHVFYRGIQTELIKKTISDDHGNFKVKLDPGKYSLFIKEPQGFYASQFNGGGYINLVEVQPQKITETEIRIDYMAAY
ncbi:MAG: carboxypeptidase regulatory-like domain-containing protein [Cyclobacteriaceae bacterium]|nr:carboxypeptidase regulatory-like domain-containing protein [Cyclobacteriaceae bacterium]